MMALEKFIYVAFEKPVFRAFYWIVALFLLVWGLIGGGSFFWEVLTGEELRTSGNLEFYGKALVWLVLVIVWVYIFRLTLKFSKEHEKYQIRWELADSDRLGLEPEKWDAGFKTHFEKEFSKWELTEAEKEVGLLILTGMSQEEIAKCRETTLKTVKNQTTVIYEKAQVKNGKELMSYFIQKLLPSTDEDLKEGKISNS